MSRAVGSDVLTSARIGGTLCEGGDATLRVSMRRKRIESATEQPVVLTILVILAGSFPPVLLAFRILWQLLSLNL
jgi:hypothetical protein